MSGCRTAGQEAVPALPEPACCMPVPCITSEQSEQKLYAEVSSDPLAGTLLHAVFVLTQHVCDLSMRLLE